MASDIADLIHSLESLARTRTDLWRLSACGVTRSQRGIPALIDKDAYAASTDRARVLLVAGLSGRPEDVTQALRALEAFAASDRLPERIALSAVPCGNPDGLALGVGPGNGAGGSPSAGYPPEDGFFDHPHDPEKRYLWRWVCFQAPDLVLEVRASESVRWEANPAATHLASSLRAERLGPADCLLAALGTGKPDGLGQVPGLRLSAPPQRLQAELDRLWSVIAQAGPLGPSPARVALDKRRTRSPLEIGSILASAYGHRLDPLIYTQGVAVSGRLRLAALNPERTSPVQDIVSLVSPYLSSTETAFGDPPETAALAGVVWGGDLADATGDNRYSDMVVRAADRYAPRGAGEAPVPADPDFRVEDMFFDGAVLGLASSITGKARYIDLLARFLLDTKNAKTQQDDGLFWHSRSASWYWGRGNGFAAMGLAEALTYLPEDHADRGAVLSMCVKQLDALSRFQEPSGMFPQVLDFPGSYQELTATCMIGYAVARGLRLGWLDESFHDTLRLAWQGVSERIDDAGKVVDGCAGTGVQASLRDYLDRPAISGFDDRSGGMALWFAVEMERLSRAR